MTTAKFEEQEVRYSPGPFGEIRSIKNCICSDGRQRTAFTTSTADTFFSIPAYVNVKGKKVSGFITRETLQGYTREFAEDPAVWKFIAYQYGKNAALLPRGAYLEKEASR